MKFTSTALAVASVLGSAFAQNSTSTGGASNYTAGLTAALQQNNLTLLASVIAQFPNVTSALQSGNFSVFAPSDAALTALISSGAANTSQGLNLSLVQQVLFYHVSPVLFNLSSIGTGENHTIVPSALKAPLLGSNATAPLVLSNGTDGMTKVRTASQNVSVMGTVRYQNLIVHPVDQVILPPMNVTSTLGAANLTGLVGAVQLAPSSLITTLASTPKLTIFAPNNAAFANISSLVSQLNQTTIATVLANHIVNGSVVYSTAISANTTAVSAAGQTFSFLIQNGTVYVVSGGTVRARVIRTDIPITNGVVHVIDAVLANTASNTTAAAAAASSYAAATSTPGVAGAGAAGSSSAPSATPSSGAVSKYAMGLGSVAGLLGAAVAVIA